MNVFCVIDGKARELTIENFENETKKLKPYYCYEHKREKHYALCPICRNPVQIVNLYKVDYIDVTQRRLSRHARHIRRNVDGLARYNNDRYWNCPLHNAASFGHPVLRQDNAYNEYIRQLIDNNRSCVYQQIRELLGVGFKFEYLREITDAYLAEANYQYTHTHEFNIPYSIIYTSPALSIFGRKLLDNEQGNKIKNVLEKQSEMFGIEDGQVKKKVMGFANISIQLCRHRKQGTNWKMTIRIIEEKPREYTKCIYEDEIDVEDILISNP